VRLAAIADVHGNLLALEAVLTDLRTASPDLVVNLGDLASGPFDPARATEVQIQLDCPTVRGNHDRWVVDEPLRHTDALARRLLSAPQLAWLAGLPPTLQLADGKIFACHGSPAGGDTEYLLEDVSTGRAVLADEAQIAPRLQGIGRASLVLCAHTHMARVAMVGNILVVNPGSVGWAAYRDDDPVVHAIETGSPHARYALLTRNAEGWTTELRAVRYDWHAAARQAEQHGSPNVAYSARTGRVPPPAS
jgi:predicted phosphodiesterase